MDDWLIVVHVQNKLKAANLRNKGGKVLSKEAERTLSPPID